MSDNKNRFFLLRVVFRFLFRSQSIGVLPWLTVFALLSIAVGVATLIMVLAVMNGFSMTLQEQLVGIYSPIRVYPDRPGQVEIEDVRKKVEDREQIDEIIGVIQGEVLFKAPGDNYQGGRIMAFTEWREGRLPVDKPPEEGLYLGRMLANKLWIVPGDEIVAIRPDARETPFGVLPGGQKLQVEGTVETGFQDMDQFLGLASIELARGLYDLQPGKVSYVELWIEDRFQAEKIKEKLKEDLPGYRLVTWIEANPTLFEALQLEEKVYFVVLVLIVLVAAINILSMMVLSILQRRKQIAMMMSMGAGPKTILLLFLAGGLIVTSVGVLVGFGFGLTGAYLLENVIMFELPAVYPMKYLPVQISYPHLLLIAAVALVLGFLSSLYPAWKASQIDPAEVLRYG
ncbi:MAG: FtsX-like permease family protein [bacterium]